MKTLILLRHGKSDWSQGTPDHERPINQRGRLAASLMAAWLADEGLVPERMLVSSALRTRQTADRLVAGWGEVPREERDELYLAEPDAILSAIQGARGGDTLLVLGHNPGIEAAAGRLASGPCPAAMPTCAAAVLRFAVSRWGDVGCGGGDLLYHVTPKSLV